MTVPTEGNATHGRRIAGLTPAEMGLGLTPDGDTQIDTTRVGAAPEPAAPLVFAGDIVSASTTLAVDLDTGGVSFFRYEHKTVAQPGESNEDVYVRVAQTVNDGVINLIDDVEDRLAEHEQQRKAAEARLAGAQQ